MRGLKDPRVRFSKLRVDIFGLLPSQCDGNMLGEFEYLLISAAARLGENAYGASIQQDMSDSTGRRCSTGALYTTLDRLEAKGLIKTWMGDPTPQRGGRRKRMVQVTAKGAREAASFYNAVMRASRGVSWETSRAGSNL